MAIVFHGNCLMGNSCSGQLSLWAIVVMGNCHYGQLSLDNCRVTFAQTSLILGANGICHHACRHFDRQLLGQPVLFVGFGCTRLSASILQLVVVLCDLNMLRWLPETAARKRFKRLQQRLCQI